MLGDAEGGGQVLDREPGVAGEAEDQPQVGRGHGLTVLVVALPRRLESLRAELDGGGQLVACRALPPTLPAARGCRRIRVF